MADLYQITRARLNKKNNSERGMVLVLVTLFLSVISLLALNLLNGSLLETKMSRYFHDKTRAFYMAENYLEQYEQTILDGGEVKTAAVIDTSLCKVTFYRVFASAEYHQASSRLQSTLAKVGDIAQCAIKPNIKQGRQSFLALN